MTGVHTLAMTVVLRGVARNLTPSEDPRGKPSRPLLPSREPRTFVYDGHNDKVNKELVEFFVGNLVKLFEESLFLIKKSSMKFPSRERGVEYC